MYVTNLRYKDRNVFYPEKKEQTNKLNTSNLYKQEVSQLQHDHVRIDCVQSALGQVNNSSGYSLNVVLNEQQLNKFKTQLCPYTQKSTGDKNTEQNESNQAVQQNIEQAHNTLQYPYYYNCRYYHSPKDRRRAPICSHNAQSNKGQLRYSIVYMHDDIADDNSSVCNNWIQYQYHPHIYKHSPCSNSLCSRKYCSKLHSRQQPNASIPISQPKQVNSTIQPTIQLINKLRNVANPQQLSMFSNGNLTNQFNIVSSNILAYSRKLYDHEQAEANKLGCLKKQIFNLAQNTKHNATISNYETRKPFQINPSKMQEGSKNAKNQDDYDILFFNEQLNIVQDRQHEFKMFRDKDPRRISALVLQYISAFLNSQGGSIYLGINDQSIVHGLDVTQQWLDKFKLQVDSDGRDHLVPPLIPQKYNLRIIPVKHPRKVDLKVIQVKVFPQMQTQRKILTLYKKQCYLRMNASNHRLSAADIMQYMRLINCNSHTSNSITNTNNNSNGNNNANNATSSTISNNLTTNDRNINNNTQSTTNTANVSESMPPLPALVPGPAARSTVTVQMQIANENQDAQARQGQNVIVGQQYAQRNGRKQYSRSTYYAYHKSVDKFKEKPIDKIETEKQGRTTWTNKSKQKYNSQQNQQYQQYRPKWQDERVVVYDDNEQP